MLIRKVTIFLLCISIQFSITTCSIDTNHIPDPSIRILFPNSEKEIKIGEWLHISWNSVDVNDYLRIDLYNNGMYTKNIDTNAPNNYEYSWYPSDDLQHSENYQIKITDILDSNIFAFSDEFLIYRSVIFMDNNLNTVIRNILGNPSEITTKDLVNITNLNARDKYIWSINGLNNCINLIELDISNNYISDISEIAELTNLKTLIVSDNSVTDLSSINLLEDIQELEVSNLNLTDLSLFYNLNNLTSLVASNNQIVDISEISNLSGIKNIRLNNNQVSDISDIESLDSLEYLNLSNNQINNISSLSDLPNLQTLLIHWNQILDIEPLILNPDINSGDVVILTGNPLNDISINTYIPQLVARGVTVAY